MADRKDQPAQLKRQIERLERQLEAERQRAEKAWAGYRAALYENVEVKMKLETIERVLRGEHD